jgi:hypothetical protein
MKRWRWPWIAAIGVVCIVMPAVVYTWMMHLNWKPPTGSGEKRDIKVASPAGKSVPATSKAVQKFEQAVQVDPYNADAWFSLAKAQADVHRPDDAISSAQKAIDVARSRNRAALVDTVETWLRSYRASESRRPTPLPTLPKNSL